MLLVVLFGRARIAAVDWKTIFELFTLMLLIGIYEKLGIITWLARKLLASSHNQRGLLGSLLLLAIGTSFFFTNDIAILTLVPLYYHLHHEFHLSDARVITYLAIFANLGSALSPFGNPQNIYLVSKFQPSLAYFGQIALPLAGITVLLLVIILLSTPKIPVQSQVKVEALTLTAPAVFCLVVGSLAGLATLLNFMNLTVGLVLLVVITLYLAPSQFTKLDYGILLTFFNFFLIVGAISSLPFVSDLYGQISSRFGQFIAAALTSQIISNVPVAILLDKFHFALQPLFWGVSIGGLGTLVASLANLLALRQYRLHFGVRAQRIWPVFLGINLLLLLILTGIAALLLH